MTKQKSAAPAAEAAPAVTPEAAADAALAIAEAIAVSQSVVESASAKGIEVSTSSIVVEDNTDAVEVTHTEAPPVEVYELPGGVVRSDF